MDCRSAWVFVAGDHRRGAQRFGGVEGGEPLVDSGDSIGFGQVQVHTVVDDVPGNEKAHVGYVQHCCRVGVGVTDLDWNESDALEFETLLVDDGHVQFSGG